MSVPPPAPNLRLSTFFTTIHNVAATYDDKSGLFPDVDGFLWNDETLLFIEKSQPPL